MEAKRLDGRQIANRAVGDVTDTFERQADGGMNFTDEGSESRARVDVLEYHDAGRGHRREVLPEIDPVIITSARHGRSGGSNAAGDGIAEHRRKAWETAAHGAGNEAFITRADVEPLDGV